MLYLFEFTHIKLYDGRTVLLRDVEPGTRVYGGDEVSGVLSRTHHGELYSKSYAVGWRLCSVVWGPPPRDVEVVKCETGGNDEQEIAIDNWARITVSPDPTVIALEGVETVPVVCGHGDYEVVLFVKTGT